MSDIEEQHDERAHKGLLQAIGSLSKVQHIRQPTRNETQYEQDEFRLIKTTKKKVLDPVPEAKSKTLGNAVHIGDLVRLLKTKESHFKAGKALASAQVSKKVLPRPLEKPAAQRINRSVAYSNVRSKLKRWNAVVTKNRSSETQVFPLPAGETIFVDTSAHSKPLQLACKSDLMLEMEQTDKRLKQLVQRRMGDIEDLNDAEVERILQGKLAHDELVARRKELAYLKVRQAQAALKARQKGKIKSKKYHKLQKRAKIQEQIKQFELLKKTNPELALERLNELERSRVQERASLRHKNTGTWAKNLQMRAKYDKDVRKDLAEQLQVSRELTQKKQDVEQDNLEQQEDAAEDSDAETEVDPFNPWTKKASNAKKALKTETDTQNWRKYWQERNQQQQLLAEFKAETVKDKKNKDKSLVAKPKSKQNQKEPVYENGWLVEELTAQERAITIDDIFDLQEKQLEQQVQQKLQRLTQVAKKLDKKLKKGKKKGVSKRVTNSPSKDLEALSFKHTGPKRPVIDEELNAADVTENNTARIPTEQEPEAEVDVIDPNKVATVRLQEEARDLHEFNKDIDADAHVEEHEDKQLTISQAFEDDDIVADFGQEKEEDTKLKDTEVDLFMPGWGSWAGAGISQEVMAAKASRARQRLLLQPAPVEKRTDANKQHVYVNENPSKDLRSHLVNNLPFPFTSVKDYEASIRAPLGRNYVTETAFRALTRPSVITRKGQVIEPMDESELVKRPRKLNHEVDKRIENAFKKSKGTKVVKRQARKPLAKK